MPAVPHLPCSPGNGDQESTAILGLHAKTNSETTPEDALPSPPTKPLNRETKQLLKHIFPFSFSSTSSPLQKDDAISLDWNVFVAFSAELSKHLEDRKDVSLTAFLWPIDSRISEESDSIQGGSVLCKFHLDIDFCAKPLERLCL